MFNNFNLSDEEIMKIIEDYKPLILNKSMINNRLDEDLNQEILIKIFKVLSTNRNIYKEKIKKILKKCNIE